MEINLKINIDSNDLKIATKKLKDAHSDLARAAKKASELFNVFSLSTYLIVTPTYFKFANFFQQIEENQREAEKRKKDLARLHESPSLGHWLFYQSLRKYYSQYLSEYYTESWIQYWEQLERMTPQIIELKEISIKDDNKQKFQHPHLIKSMLFKSNYIKKVNPIRKTNKQWTGKNFKKVR